MNAEDRAVLITAVSEVAVLRALQMAGNRILGKHDRSVRGPMRSVEPWLVHTHLRVDEQDIAALLKDAWRIPVAVGLPDSLIEALDQHTRVLFGWPAVATARDRSLATRVSGLPGGRPEYRKSTGRREGRARRRLREFIAKSLRAAVGARAVSRHGTLTEPDVSSGKSASDQHQSRASRDGRSCRGLDGGVTTAWLVRKRGQGTFSSE